MSWLPGNIISQFCEYPHSQRSSVGIALREKLLNLLIYSYFLMGIKERADGSKLLRGQLGVILTLFRVVLTMALSYELE